MRNVAAALIVLFAVSCGSQGSAPSAPSPSVVPAPVPLPPPTPIPVPTPFPQPTRTVTLSGVVTDGLDGSGLSLVSVNVNINGVLAAGVTGANGRYSVTMTISFPSGPMTFSRAGFIEQFSSVLPADEATVNVILPRACTSSPRSAPRALVQSDYVDFDWDTTSFGRLLYPGVRDYLVEVGRVTTPFRSSGPLKGPDVFSTATGGAAFYKWKTPSTGPGSHWMRFRTKNECGLSEPSSEVSFTLR